MKKRFRQLPIIIGGLSALALGSVGFSAWVIAGIGNVSGNSGNIELHVASTTDKRMNMAVTGSDDLKVNFDCHKDDNELPFVFEGTEKDGEDLIFAFKLSITNALNSNGTAFNEYYKGIKLTLAATNTKTLTLEEALRDNYIESPFGGTLQTIDLTSKTLTSAQNIGISESTYTITPNSIKTTADLNFSMKFKWGTKFGNVNPGTWKETNQIGGIKTADAVKDALTLLSGLNETTFNITAAFVA